MTQLNEAKEVTKPGVTKVTGTYGKEYDAGDDGSKKKPASDVKKGRGRPKKDADETGEVKKYDTSSLGNVFGGGKKPSKPVGKVSKKNTLKDWFEQLDKAIVNEGGLADVRAKMQQRGAGAPSVQRTNQAAMGRIGQMANRPTNVEEAGLSPTQTMVPGMQAGGNAAQPTVIDIKNNPALKAALDKAAEQKQITTVGIPQTGASSTQQKPGQAQTSGPMGASNQQAMAEDELDEMSPYDPYGDDEKVDAINAANPPKATAGRLVPGMSGTPGKSRQTTPIPQKSNSIDLDAWDKAHGRNEVEEDGEKWIQKAIKHPGALTKKAHAAGMTPSAFAKKHAHDSGTTGKQSRLAQTLSKLKEADRPTHDGDEGANLGAGRNPYVLEGAKPDYIDLDKDGNKKESMKKAAQDAKKKTKVKESMDHRLKAAHHRGKSHALAKEAYNCHYDDMEEARQYHEGFKEGLDECYGQMPIQGYVGEMGQSTVDDMASFGAHTPTMEDDMEEGNAFTKKLATTPAGGSFSLGGKSFRDTSNYDSSVFESWDNELNSLLEEYDSITEGITVSSSQGQANQPDSVSVTASDSDAQQLMQVLRSAGIGGFGGGETQGQPGAMTVDTGEPEEIGTGGAEIDVVDDHGNMMDLIRKVTGGAPKGPEQGFGGSDDEEEEHEHGEEETCDACGSADCECDDEESGEEQQVDEVESEDQMEYEVAEDNAPDSGATEEAEEVADTQQANQSASEYDAAQDEEQVEESYANGADDTFEADIAYMTKVISGGLNKEKSTGQTTIPVVAGQGMRTGVTESKQLNESVNDWKKLAGIK